MITKRPFLCPERKKIAASLLHENSVEFPQGSNSQIEEADLLIFVVHTGTQLPAKLRVMRSVEATETAKMKESTAYHE